MSAPTEIGKQRLAHSHRASSPEATLGLAMRRGVRVHAHALAQNERGSSDAQHTNTQAHHFDLPQRLFQQTLNAVEPDRTAPPFTQVLKLTLARALAFTHTEGLEREVRREGRRARERVRESEREQERGRERGGEGESERGRGRAIGRGRASEEESEERICSDLQPTAFAQAHTPTHLANEHTRLETASRSLCRGVRACASVVRAGDGAIALLSGCTAAKEGGDR
eukprot:4319951-Pleurochrysis_carterae.AAC.1